MEPRVLQVLTDNDAVDDNLAALELHRGLSRSGVEVRTLALAPGGDAGLAMVVPTMAPSARSLAAHTQFRREQRWADVVILRGEAPAAAAGVVPLRHAAPTVLHLADEVDRWRSSPAPSRALRTAVSADALVVRRPADATVAERLDRPPDVVHVVPYGVDGAAPISDAQPAARRELGLAPNGFVALLVGEGPAVEDLHDRAGRLDVTCTDVGPGADDVVRFGAQPVGDRSELAVAAADVVLVAGQDGDAVPWWVLRAAASGLAVVGPVFDGLAGPQDAPIGWSDLAAAVAAGRDEASRRGAAAASAVGERFSSARAVGRWLDLLRVLAER